MAPLVKLSAEVGTLSARRALSQRTSLVSLVVAVGLTAAACGGGDETGAQSGTGDKNPKVQAEAKAGGSMTMLAVQDSASLDPFKTSYVAIADEPRMSALYDPMVYLDPTDNTVKPHLAESLTTPDGGKTWQLKLRPGVKFSDGTPFNAEAVKRNWEMHADPAVQSQHRAVAAGLVINVVDELTLTVTPAGMPNANFDRVIASDLTYIASPAQLAKGPDEYRNKPVGAGPFKLENWTRGSEQVFVKNPDYWQKDKGLPKLDKLTFKNVPDVKQQYSTVQSGGADLFPSSDPATIRKAQQEMNAVSMDVLGGQIFQFNLKRAPFDDPRARKAVALAMDPVVIPETLGIGYTPAKSIFSQTSPFFDASVAQPAHNKEEAQRLFDELAAEGKKVDFTYLLPQNPVSQKVAEYMQSRLQAYKNVSMKLESLEIGAYIEKYAIRRDFQAMLYQQWITDPEPALFSALFSQSPLNAIGWNNPEADKALLAGRSSNDPTIRKQAYSELQKQLSADLPIWVYGESSIAALYNKRVTGVVQYNGGTVFMDRIGLK